LPIIVDHWANSGRILKFKGFEFCEIWESESLEFNVTREATTETIDRELKAAQRYEPEIEFISKDLHGRNEEPVIDLTQSWKNLFLKSHPDGIRISNTREIRD